MRSGLGRGGAVRADELVGPRCVARRDRVNERGMVLTQRLDNGAVVTLTRSKELNQAVLATEDMPAPEEGTVYEVWLQHDDVMVPAGLMDEPGSHGAAEG